MLKQSATLGKPSLNIVVAHLRYLSSQGWKSSIDLMDYAKDLYTVYSFIDSHDSLMENQQLLEDGKLWCNISIKRIPTISAEQFRLSWIDAKGLRTALVNGKERIGFLESILNQFPKILIALGLDVSEPQMTCASITHPIFSGAGPKPELEAMRRLGNFCDIELNICGINFKAHRLVLATASGYWRKTLTEANYSIGGINIDQDFSKDTVLGILEYFYTNKIPAGLELEGGTATGAFLEWLKIAREWEVVELQVILENILLRASSASCGS